MGVVPNKILEKIQWFEQRVNGWQSSGAAIGLSPALINSFKAKLLNARAKYDLAQAARIASKSATVVQDSAVADMARGGADMIAFIRSFAESSADPASIYALANVPPPADPTPAGPPQAPTDVVADPNADGTITLRWKGSLANQTFFSIWRKVGSGQFVSLGSVAAKVFVDEAVPTPAPATPTVTYQVRAQRNLQVSEPSDDAVVTFGNGGAMAA